MSGLSRKGKKTAIGGQFAPRLIEMLESPAYRALSLSGHRVLARIEVEIGHHGGNDNGKLPVTFDHFHQYGIHRHSIAPAVRETVALGFVEVTQKGRSGNGEYRRPSLYRLTYRPTDSLGATDEWKKIATTDEAERIANDARKNKRPVPVSASFQCRKPHHKSKSPVPETITTSLSAETITTSISREDSTDVGGTPSARPPKGQARDGVVASTVEPIGVISDALARNLKKKGLFAHSPRSAA